MAQNINPIQLQKHLKGVDYPANKEQLLQKAQENGADDNAIQALQALPEESFETPADVSKHISEAGSNSDE